MRKLIKISTHMFELTIRWNGAIMGLQFAILFGIVMLRLFSSNGGVDKLCNVILIFNAIVILFVLLSGLHFEVTDAASTGNESTNVPSNNSPPSPVNREAPPKPARKACSSKQNVINNKVPVPKQNTAVPAQTAPTPEKPVTTPAAETDLSSKTVEEMSEADWEALFKMDEE